MKIDELSDLIAAQKSMVEFFSVYEKNSTIALSSICGSARSLIVAESVKSIGGIHIVVMDDRDMAGYLAADLYSLLDDSRVLFLPTGYKRSIQFGQEDPSGIVQRTATLNAIKNFTSDYLVVCTYPEALAEKVIDKEQLNKNTLKVRVGDKISVSFLEQLLVEHEFERVDFVHNPGQYSVRGGIIDVFSFSNNKPFRFDFFGDEIDSIRSFELASQLSVEKLPQVEIIPNLKRNGDSLNRVSFAKFTKHATYWISDFEFTLKRFNEIRSKILKELEEPTHIDTLVTGRKGFLSDTQESKIILFNDNARERVADKTIEFTTSPQPQFNKKFELLAEDIKANILRGYSTVILSENKAQVERLENVFSSIGESDLQFNTLSITLHEGFIDHNLKLCLYTDHQIFDRHHRYRIQREIDKSVSLTIAELNSLKVGDYVTHIDHGVGKFGGLAKAVENGKVRESIKLIYKDGDVLLVNIHSLHRISRYKDKDAEAPKIHKLGSGAWQKIKSATKKAVKDIARELIALYAKRKASGGFRFSPDSYLQHELEASFAYEDTPDQEKATEAIKQDMESPQPMDRLICGDVGFGKTEVAIRAAFKAVTDSKQVAILVPTTILALQHYRTFNSRLKGFPVRVEYLSRSKSSKDTTQLLSDLAEGKIDILIGTHKILGKNIQFKSLGLLIIDEEQKFGVSSKEKLRHMSVNVDTLTLTATPIPRTLQFSLMGSRDLSIISTPPPNRQPITTESHLFDEQIIKEAIDFEMSRGGQVYFIHNRVTDILRIEGILHRLCPEAKIVIGHGQMNPQELERKLMDFIYGEYDILVATTIIENGVDIANANTIIINNAQNFGLSELHQLRGRVGRSNKKAFCYLISPPDEVLTSEARRRLRAIEEFSDLGSGFNIAMQDLDIRGAGNILGAEQSGFIANIGFETYQKILNEAMEELRSEGIDVRAKSITNHDAEPEDEITFISDANIDIDVEAIIPDSYVSQTAEKIKLYRELDNITKEEALQRFERDMVDRFGELPPQVIELFNVIRLRWLCIKLGFEKAKLKNGLMIMQFVQNNESLYYKSDIFMAILQYISTNSIKFVLRQNNNKLALTVRKVTSIAEGCEVLTKMYDLCNKKEIK